MGLSSSQETTDHFMGMRGVYGHTTEQTPTSYREKILQLYPNGRAPLVALTSKMRSQPVTSFQHNYYIKRFSDQGGTLQGSGLYTDSALGSALGAGTVAASTILYVKLTTTTLKTVGQADIGEFREGHTVRLRYSGDPDVDTECTVSGVQVNGASSYLTVMTNHATVASAAGYDLSVADECWVSGSSHPDGGMPPDAVNYVPSLYTTQTQIFKTTLELTGSAEQEEVRGVPNLLVDERRDALERHAVEMEKAFWWAKYGEVTGSNGQPERRTRGIWEFISTYASGNISNFQLTTGAAYTGQDWDAKGYDWLEEVLTPIFRYGPFTDRLAFTGDLGLLAINRLVRLEGYQEITRTSTAFGFVVFDWLSPAGLIHIWTHPLYSHMPSLRRTMLIMHPSNIVYRPKRNRDTKRTDVTPKGFDGIKEQYLTECLLELHHPEMWGLIHGLGLNNAN